MSRGVAEARLRVWTPQGSEVLFVRQVAPTVQDLTDRAERIIGGDVVVVGYSQLGSVCHYCSRTRTHSDAMDVA